MPIPDYNGSTFVAYVDISGFKEMMKHEKQAVTALDHFYSAGFRALQRNNSIHGIFISDCAILFVNNHEQPLNQICLLLKVIDELNRDVLDQSIMLTTSIAYGQFSYDQRVEIEGIEKNPVYGNAYVSAYLDNASDRQKIQPGECRILKQNIEQQDLMGIPRIENRNDRYYYYYWMLNDGEQIVTFRNRYDDAYQQKYRGMLEALKDAVNNRLRIPSP